jgi:hypothetical protein
MRSDKVIVELMLLLLAFMALWVFTPDIIPLLEDAEASNVGKPLQSLFLFFRYIMELFTHLTAIIVLYIIGGGIIFLNGRRS